MLPPLVSRDDILISYSRADGAAYATGLADGLTAKGFSCFFRSPRHGAGSRASGIAQAAHPQLHDGRAGRHRRRCSIDVRRTGDRGIPEDEARRRTDRLRRRRRPCALVLADPRTGRRRREEPARTPDRRAVEERRQPDREIVPLYATQSAHAARLLATLRSSCWFIGSGLAATYWATDNAKRATEEAKSNRAEAARAKQDADARRAEAAQAQTDADTQKRAARAAGEEAVRQQELARVNASTAKERLVDLSQEQGRLELLRGNRQQGLVYLTDAYGQRPNDEALRFLLAVARRSLVVSLRGASPEPRRREIELYHVAVSPDGGRIVTASDHAIKLWNARDGTLEHTLQSDEAEREGATFATFLKDGSLVLSQSLETMKLWDAKTGRLIRTLPDLGGSKGYGRSTNDITQISPDQTRLLIPGQTPEVFEIESGRLLFALQSQNDAAGMWGDNYATFSPDGRLTSDYLLASSLYAAVATSCSSLEPPGRMRRRRSSGSRLVRDRRRRQKAKVLKTSARSAPDSPGHTEAIHSPLSRILSYPRPGSDEPHR